MPPMIGEKFAHQTGHPFHNRNPQNWVPSNPTMYFILIVFPMSCAAKMCNSDHPQYIYLCLLYIYVLYYHILCISIYIYMYIYINTHSTSTMKPLYMTCSLYISICIYIIRIQSYTYICIHMCTYMYCIYI